MPGDPRWITLKWPGLCTGCGRQLPKGSRAFYYPATRAVYAAGCCAEAHARDFQSHAHDEAVYHGQG